MTASKGMSMSDHVKKWLLPFGALVLVPAIFFVVRAAVSCHPVSFTG
jgi:hypothetical protein